MARLVRALGGEHLHGSHPFSRPSPSGSAGIARFPPSGRTLFSPLGLPSSSLLAWFMVCARVHRGGKTIQFPVKGRKLIEIPSFPADPQKLVAVVENAVVQLLTVWSLRLRPAPSFQSSRTAPRAFRDAVASLGPEAPVGRSFGLFSDGRYIPSSHLFHISFFTKKTNL